VTVRYKGRLLVTGPFSSTATKVAFLKGEKGEGACPGVGRYKWAKAGCELTLTKIADSCRGRETIFSYPFRAAGKRQ
jgi:hypothetical protein